jgi:hypothetical protein
MILVFFYYNLACHELRSSSETAVLGDAHFEMSLEPPRISRNLEVS